MASGANLRDSLPKFGSGDSVHGPASGAGSCAGSKHGGDLCVGSVELGGGSTSRGALSGSDPGSMHVSPRKLDTGDASPPTSKWPGQGLADPLASGAPSPSAANASPIPDAGLHMRAATAPRDAPPANKKLFPTSGSR
jgi:hypothetical protein